jgi:dipeptidase E
MLLYLTSIASKTLDLLIPFLDKKPEELKAAFIPTAADLYSEKPWVRSDKEKFVDLGFNVKTVDIKLFSKEMLRQELKNADIIFVTGGTTTYLLEKARESGFDQIVKELFKKGVIYIGSSAGSVLAGPTVEVDRIYDHRNLGGELDSYEGLRLTETVVLPHSDNEKYAVIIKEIERRFGNKFKLQKLNDNQALLVKNGYEQVLEI